MFMCRDNATLPYPQCETELLAAVLESVVQSPSVQQQWREAGGHRAAPGLAAPALQGARSWLPRLLLRVPLQLH